MKNYVKNVPNFWEITNFKYVVLCIRPNIEDARELLLLLCEPQKGHQLVELNEA